MSRKGVPADPAAEREELRRLTRELHEAAQAAREQARELRAAVREADAALDARRAIIADDVAAVLQPIIDAHGQALQEAVNTSIAAINDDYDTIRKNVDRHFHEFLAPTSPDDFIREMATQTAKWMVDHPDGQARFVAGLSREAAKAKIAVTPGQLAEGRLIFPG